MEKKRPYRKLLQRKCVEAVVAGMYIIRQAQFLPQTSGEAVVKGGDATIVTKTDKIVERTMHEILKGIPGTRFLGEEGEASGTGDLTIMVDPLDGTRPFAIRLATSTVIVALVHPYKGVVLVVVGDPATGRIWSATEDGHTTLSILNYGRDMIETPIPVNVWQGELGGKRQAVVFTDHSLGFTRAGRRILTDAEVAMLLGMIPIQATLLMPGSNGMNFALVANGSEFMAGQITTAVGGPWDIAPVLLVLQAGGTARGFSVKDDKLKEENPRDVGACDIMVSGNSAKTVNTLVSILQSITF